MSLEYYSDKFELPAGSEVIYDNRSFFAQHTLEKLDARVNGLLKHSDNAVYKDDMRFTDKFGYDVPWMGLSTGGMTVLNIFYNPDVIFAPVECGINALQDITMLSQGSAVSHIILLIVM